MSFDLARFNEIITTRAFGQTLLFEESVGSTMDLARDAAKHGVAEGAVALTDEQTAGRGRLGRSWITPPGVNLASTIVLRPPRSSLREVAMIVPLAIAHAVEETCGLRCGIKWPNDVMVGDRKLAGVLIETEGADQEQALVLVGAGINVNFDPRQHEEIREIATSVRAETGREADREALFASYLLHFERLYDEVKAGESVRDRWRERLVTLGREVRATSTAGVVEGTAEDVDDDGALLVRTSDGSLVSVEAADVTLRG